MAIYGNPADLRPKALRAFREDWRGGDTPILPGIYRCSCGEEWPLRYGEALPEHEHAEAASWRLVVATEEPTVVNLPPTTRATAAPARARVA